MYNKLFSFVIIYSQISGESWIGQEGVVDDRHRPDSHLCINCLMGLSTSRAKAASLFFNLSGES